MLNAEKSGAIGEDLKNERYIKSTKRWWIRLLQINYTTKLYITLFLLLYILLLLAVSPGVTRSKNLFSQEYMREKNVGILMSLYLRKLF